MKSVYWRPQKVAGSTTLYIGLFAIAVLAVVELLPRFATPKFAEDKLAANQHAQLCRYKIREVRKSQGLKVNTLFDPTKSGLIGTAMTSLTSKPANLEAKQLSLHPQFPSAVVQMLRDAGVRNGNTVAVGWTGSFPALNIALSSAIESMELNPIAVASVTASQYGANESELTWLDMESSLHEAGLIGFRSCASTIGGPSDCGRGMSDESRTLAIAAMKRNGVSQIKAKHLSQSIERRMRTVNRAAKDRPIAAYINVGGGVASSGGSDCVFQSGLNLKIDADEAPDCIMQRFAANGTPVIHLARPRTLARRLHFSNEQTASMVYASTENPNRWLAASAFLIVCFVLRGVVLKDFGNRIGYAILRRLSRKPEFRAVGQVSGPQLMA